MSPVNGWQRLWILLSALWIVPVLLLAHSWWPPDDKYANSSQGTNGIVAILDDVQQQHDLLAIDRRSVIGNAVALWIVPPVVLYAMAISIAWVRRGWSNGEVSRTTETTWNVALTRRDWWLGIAIVAIAILIHAAIPRYEWRSTGDVRLMIRVDRWTGGTVPAVLRNGQWTVR